METALRPIMGIEYDAHTDSTYYVPECWYCGMPLSGLEESDIGNEIECPYCERKIRIPDADWIRKYIEGNTGTMTDEEDCMFCDGKMTVKKIKKNGKWRTFSGVCQKCGARFIV